MSNFVFTYWEGTPYAFTNLCINSITRVFGTRHVHLTPETLPQWISISESARTCNHISFRSDLIRSLLLQRHGGWWFDCDVLLCKDPSALVQSGLPTIWNLIYQVNGEWVPLINNGILYTPSGSTWIDRIVEDFAKVGTDCLELTWQNEDIGQNIYEKHSLNNASVVVGHEHDFNSTYNVNADFAPFWDGRIKLDSARYGIHIGASLSRWAAQSGNGTARETLSIKTLEELVRRFPDSVVSQYVEQFKPRHGLP